jgi:hypothetical protein
MVKRNSNPYGLDEAIDAMQLKLYAALITYPTWVNYESYPRAEKIKDGQEVLPKVCLDGKNYTEVLFDDRKNATSFYLAGERRDFDYSTGYYTQNISLIFQGLLNKLYPNATNRADEEMIYDISKALRKIGYIHTLESIDTTIDEVYKGLTIYGEKKYSDDMSNYFVCRFNFKINYPQLNGEC